MSGQVTLGKSTWRLLLILALLSVGIAIAGYAFYSFQRDAIIRDKRDDLTTIANLKVAQIVNWRRERIADAVVVSQTPFFTRSVKEFLDGAAPPQCQDEIQQWMLSLRDSYGYKDVLLLDERRQVRLSLIGRDTLPCADSLRERRLLVQRYQHLTRHANDIILLLDAEGRIVDANEQAAVAYGYRRDELLRLNLSDVCSPNMPVAFSHRVRQIEEQGGLMYESVHVRKNGSRFPVEVSAPVIAVTEDKLIQIIIRDITERKQAEAQLRRYAEELKRSNEELA